VINDWSGAVNDLFTVDTDWVVTTPGQYLMTNQAGYIDAIEEQGDGGDPANALTGDVRCIGGTLNSTSPGGPNAYVASTGANCDFRDIPLTVTAVVYDREEREIDVTENELVVSPSPVIPPAIVNFNQEVNVIQWGTEPVLDSVKFGTDGNITIPKPAGAETGWSTVNVVSTKPVVGICEYTGFGTLPLPVTCTSTTTPVPLVGFVAWQRNFGATPDSNYGRIVEHSFSSM
jgi:hypothetical protein